MAKTLSEHRGIAEQQPEYLLEGRPTITTYKDNVA